ncbi:hypothetical protein M404DRAFT_995415 [Pisolithus tinctorius Marx 270]|uniref:Uncharacterized protein n=1 Tax=Pisolithus tinctorius Marx 270 TaxID=870435 RepID=A0A0C3PP49_PISTI|nr:hypothetical protein M404DRAFT_995415 [Pisolithus tinctorius Marx 270]
MHFPPKSQNNGIHVDSWSTRKTLRLSIAKAGSSARVVKYDMEHALPGAGKWQNDVVHTQCVFAINQLYKNQTR